MHPPWRTSFVVIGLAGVWLELNVVSAQLTPQDAIGQLGRGINIGNTLEPPQEGGWNNGPLQEYFFDDYRDAGFATVRIPVRWDEHTSDTAPYTVDASWMDRVEQVVDWGLARDFFIIINGHHEDWLKQNYASASLRARYDSIWSQIATRFQDKSDRLLFEIINEPFGMTRTEVDDLNARILGIIRRTNATRIVIFSGHDYSNSTHLLAAAIPNDPYLMGYFHSYDPWDFAGLAQGTWGTSSDRAELTSKFESVANWSASNNVPVMISEFGAIRGADFNSRMRHYSAYVEESLTHGIAFQAWDDGGDFGIYQREERGWNEVKDVLIHTYPDGPTDLATTVEGDSVLILSWVNRRSDFASLVVERRTGNGTFEQLAEIAGNATTYSDSSVTGGVTYDYRVVGRSPADADRHSYPFRVRVLPTKRSNFHGIPFMIPGVIQAEDYDVGGEGLTYHDTEEANIPGAYRPSEGVDIEPRDDGGFQVAYVESGEWLEYTVDVADDGDYALTTSVASLNGGGQFRFEFARRTSRSLIVPSTNSWQTLTTVSTTLALDAGEQIMRFFISSASPFNIDRFVIERVGATAVEADSDRPTFDVFPNPARDWLRVSVTDARSSNVQIELFDSLGRRLRTVTSRGSEEIKVDGLPRGVYVCRVQLRAGVVRFIKVLLV